MTVDLLGHIRRHDARWALVAALLAPLGSALAFVPFRESFTNVGAALVFVALVEGLAIWGRRRAGYLATVSSAIWFDFFLTTPYERLTISRRADLETTIALVVVGVVVTELAARWRRHREHAGHQGAHVAMIASTASSLVGGSTLEEVLASTSSALVDVLHLRTCYFESDLSGPPHARILADGRVAHVGMSWPAHEIGLPGPVAEIACHWRGAALGRFLLGPTPGEAVTREDRVVAVTLVNMVAARIHEEHRARG